jgi:very-short-patch-repair endonuclease
MVIEIDGGQHADSTHDCRRDEWFASNSFQVLRFWNNEVLSNIEGVLTSISDALKEVPPHPAPPRVPSPTRGEGTFSSKMARK